MWGHLTKHNFNVFCTTNFLIKQDRKLYKKHKLHNTNGKQSVENDTNKKDDDNDKSDGILEIDDEDSSEEIVHERDQTFLNPSQSDDADEKSETDTEERTENDDEEKTDNLEEEVEYKCELCIFKTKDSKRFVRHSVEIY